MSSYRDILVALDGSADSNVALDHAADLAREQNARLTLVSVVPRASTPVAAGAATRPDLEPDHCAIVRAALHRLPGDVGVTTRIERGEVAPTLLRLIADGDYDLLVMGSHGHGRVHRALLGSVSERVLHAASIPVLLLRSRCAQAAAGPAATGAATPDPLPATG